MRDFLTDIVSDDNIGRLSDFLKSYVPGKSCQKSKICFSNFIFCLYLLLMGTVFHISQFSFEYNSGVAFNHSIEVIRIEPMLLCGYDICDDIKIQNEVYAVDADGTSVSTMANVTYDAENHVFMVCITSLLF